MAVFGDHETEYDWWGWPLEDREPLGVSYWLGGGFSIPVWQRPGEVTPSLELSTSGGFSSKAKTGESSGFEGQEMNWALISVQENLILGLSVGPAKPYAGFGFGVAVAPWTLTDIASGAETDSHTEVKPSLAVPFGCDFGLGFHGEYLVITGNTTPEEPIEGLETYMPNPLNLGARFVVNL